MFVIYKFLRSSFAVVLIGSVSLVSQAQFVSVNQPNSSPANVQVVPDNTIVGLRLAETVSSAHAQEGQVIRFTVSNDVIVNNTVVIQKGAIATGVVIKAEPKKWAGRSGKLDMSLQSVTAIDGSQINLSGHEGANGESHVGRMVTGIVITSIFTLGGASIFLVMHGKDIVIPSGSLATTYTVGTSKVTTSTPGL